jgi:general secretion pathway protein H
MNPLPQGERAKFRTADCSKCASAGFTVLELLVVLALLALVGAVALPQLARPSDNVRLQAAARELVGALRVTRSTAIARNTALALVVDVDARAFESPVVARKSLSSDIALKLTVAEPERATPARGGIRFFADGSSTGGDLTLRLRDQEARICVSWLTGKPEAGEKC